jgi:redox-sensitive bicupin YhaK (pirin superfamily)
VCTWIFPDKSGLQPTYDQKNYEANEWQNRLLPVASGQNVDGVVTFHTDPTIYRCSLEAKREVAHKTTDGRRIFVYLTKGQVTANGETLKAKDQARIDTDAPLVFKALRPSELILIDVPSCKGWGYSTETLGGKRK